MSTIASSSLSAPAALVGASVAPSAAGLYRAPSRPAGARGLAALLLAAGVAALVVLADQLISTWADGHLLLAWVMLWVVIFAGMALLADTARSLARRLITSLDTWSRKRAEARAEARFWDVAQSDPRLMAEWTVASARQPDADEDFSAALAPIGVETAAAEKVEGGWGRFPERLAEIRARNIHLYYI